MNLLIKQKQTQRLKELKYEKKKKRMNIWLPAGKDEGKG